MKRSTQHLLEAARTILDDGYNGIYSALPWDAPRSVDLIVEFVEDCECSLEESADVRALIMFFAAAVSEAETRTWIKQQLSK